MLKHPLLEFITLDNLEELGALNDSFNRVSWGGKWNHFHLGSTSAWLYITLFIGSIRTAAAAVSLSAATMRKCLIVSYETMSCKNHRIIAAITVAAAIIAVPTVRCHCQSLLGMKFTTNNRYLIWPPCKNDTL